MAARVGNTVGSSKPSQGMEPTAGQRVRPLSRGTWFRLALLVVFIVAGATAARHLNLTDPGSLRHRVQDSGLPGMLVFVAAYAAFTLLILPKGVLSVTAGLAWGLLPGVPLVLVGAVLGATAAFWVGRGLGRDGVTRIAGAHLGRLDELVDRHGIAAIILVRLIPVIPFSAINYASGLTAIRFAPYLTGTAIGIVPGTIAYVALGAFGTRPTSWQFVAAAASLAGLTVVGVVLARHRHVRLRAHPATDSTVGVD